MDTNKIRTVLNVIFMILAVAAVIVYFVAGKDNFRLFLYVCGAAIFFKVMEFFIRFSNR